MLMTTITMKKGDSRTLVVTILQSDGSVFPLTSWGVIFGVKDEYPSEEYTIVKKNLVAGGDATQIEMTDAANGEFKVYLKKEDTEPLRDLGNDYIYEVQVSLNDNVKTPISGEMKLTDDVVRD